MTKYFKEITKKFETFILYVEDNIYQLKVGIRIMYKPKTNIIKNVTFDKISEKNLLNYLNFCYKEIPEFEILFDNKYTILLKNALAFHKKKYGETVLHKLVDKLNILNINDIN